MHVLLEWNFLLCNTIYTSTEFKFNVLINKKRKTYGQPTFIVVDINNNEILLAELFSVTLRTNWTFNCRNKVLKKIHFIKIKLITKQFFVCLFLSFFQVCPQCCKNSKTNKKSDTLENTVDKILISLVSSSGRSRIRCSDCLFILHHKIKPPTK